MKPYGFKSENLVALAKFYADGNFNGKPLTRAFEEFAEINGKSAGSVRNLYYALAKLSAEDEKFREEYLGGNILPTRKTEKFSENEESALIASLSENKEKGVSVRRSAIELSGGNPKKALRYQNKFRSVMKKRRESASSAKNSGEGEKIVVLRLKREINALFERTFENLKSENRTLKKRLDFLENENQALRRALPAGKNTVSEFFSRSRVTHGKPIGL